MVFFLSINIPFVGYRTNQCQFKSVASVWWPQSEVLNYSVGNKQKTEATPADTEIKDIDTRSILSIFKDHLFFYSHPTIYSHPIKKERSDCEILMEKISSLQRSTNEKKNSIKSVVLITSNFGNQVYHLGYIYM